MLGAISAKKFKMDDSPILVVTESADSTTEPSKPKDKDKDKDKDLSIQDKEEPTSTDDAQEAAETTTTSELDYDLDEELKEISPWLPALLKYFNVIS
jgi:hypothetical protein